MADGVNTGTALSSEAVDAQFWALVCDDEGWLDAEFAGIVSEPAECRATPRRPPGVWVERPRRGRWGPAGTETELVRPGRSADPHDGQWRRQRSPPPAGNVQVSSPDDGSKGW